MEDSFQPNPSFLNSASELADSRASGGRFFASLNSIQSVTESQLGLQSPPLPDGFLADAQHNTELARASGSTASRQLRLGLDNRSRSHVPTTAPVPFPGNPPPRADYPSPAPDYALPQHQQPPLDGPLPPPAFRFASSFHSLTSSSVLLEQITASGAFPVPPTDSVVFDLPAAPPRPAEPHSHSAVLSALRSHQAARHCNLLTVPASGSAHPTPLFQPLRPPDLPTAMLTGLPDNDIPTLAPGPSEELLLPPLSQDASPQALNCRELRHSLDRLHERGQTVSSASKDVWGVLLSLSPKYPTVQLTKRSDHTAGDKCGYLLGRHRECDIRFNHPQISNRHCLIYSMRTEGMETVHLEDLSTNGTFINGVKIPRHEPRLLKDGDMIKLTVYQDPNAQALDTDESFLFQHVSIHRLTNLNDAVAPFHRNYMLLHPLGSGSFADVHIAVNRLTGEQFAVKVINKKRFQLNPRVIATARAEFGILMTMTHPCVIAIHGVYDEDDSLYMVLEYARDGELFDEIVQRQGFTETETRRIFFQLFMAIKYLHDRGVVHRDLKPENILLADREALLLKLTDFGLAKVVREDAFMKTLCGTPNYVAPEVLVPGHERAYSKAVDMWSLGVILYICLCGFPPFSDDFAPPAMQYQIKNAIYRFLSPKWDTISDGAKDLVTRLLQKDPEQRLTVEQALEHPWMQLGHNGSCYTLDRVPFPLPGLEAGFDAQVKTQNDGSLPGYDAILGVMDPDAHGALPAQALTDLRHADSHLSLGNSPEKPNGSHAAHLEPVKRKWSQLSSASFSQGAALPLFEGHPPVALYSQESNLFASSRAGGPPLLPADSVGADQTALHLQPSDSEHGQDNGSPPTADDNSDAMQLSTHGVPSPATPHTAMAVDTVDAPIQQHSPGTTDRVLPTPAATIRAKTCPDWKRFKA
ncbi:serine/threonine protein kinase [Dimargaris verticillata]|uniref:Serine/threonine protein kinase n=1 Tax=Dimargaris verticillata TaxID=2761393 RepID=A0A9W8B4X7_9FUNG|nr:serine/threonine protein kinase [Dimargaris verticillata]